jgi:hypothetical protein
MKLASAIVATLFATSVFAAEPAKQPGPPNIPKNPDAKKVEAKKEAPKKAEAKKEVKKEEVKKEPAKK